MTTAANIAVWSQEVLKRDEHCRWTGCPKKASDPAHLFSRWYPSLRLIVEDGVGLCHFHHTQLDDLPREKKRAVIRLLVGRSLYEKLARLAHGVNLK